MQAILESSEVDTMMSTRDCEIRLGVSKIGNGEAYDIAMLMLIMLEILIKGYPRWAMYSW